MIKILAISYLAIASGFSLNARAKGKSSLKMTLDKNPSEIIKSFNGLDISNQWSLKELYSNIENKNIDGISIFSSQDGLAVIDSNHQDIVMSSNIHFIKTFPSLIESLVNTFNKNDINYDILNINTGNWFTDIFSNPFQFLFVYLIFSTVFNLIFRGANGGLPGMGNPMNFAKNTDSGLIDANEVGVTFEDVAGCEESKYELEEVVDFLKRPEKYEGAGAKIPKGVLLEGEPGTGKTLLARAVAGEAGVSFISASGSEFIEMFVGVGASRVRNLFDLAKKNSPCVIFIDEIDAVGRQRGAGFNSGNDEREQTLNQILTNMDGFEKTEGIIVIAATNRADILDSALLRPGRFDRKVTVPLPDELGRRKIFDVHLKDKNVDENFDLDELAILTSGFSGADIANLANEAAILSVRNNLEKITQKTFIDAFEKMTIGLPKEIETRSEDIINLVSYHEMGHALTARFFSEFFDLRKVTINANSNGAGGYTLFTPKDQYLNYPTKKFLLANLVVALGGRAAEVLLYESDEKDNIFPEISDLEVTTGASNDLKQASEIARRYVSIFGLSDDISLSGSVQSEMPFLGRELALGGDKSSEFIKEKTDKMIGKLINMAYRISLKILKDNKSILKEMCEKLSEERNLDGNDFKDINLKFN